MSGNRRKSNQPTKRSPKPWAPDGRMQFGVDRAMAEEYRKRVKRCGYVPDGVLRKLVESIAKSVSPNMRHLWECFSLLEYGDRRDEQPTVTFDTAQWATFAERCEETGRTPAQVLQAFVAFAALPHNSSHIAFDTRVMMALDAMAGYNDCSGYMELDDSDFPDAEGRRARHRQYDDAAMEKYRQIADRKKRVMYLLENSHYEDAASLCDIAEKMIARQREDRSAQRKDTKLTIERQPRKPKAEKAGAA